MAYIQENGRLIWIPSLDNMHDYIEPGGLGWNDSLSIYHYEVVYLWKHESGKKGTRVIRVKHPSHARVIIDHWNKQNTAWTYEIV